MASAKYTIDGDPSENLGFDAENNQILELQLENLPTTDISRTHTAEKA